MMKNLPLEKAFLYVERGPIVLVTTFDGKKNNVMTISWTMVMDFNAQFALLTGAWNHSFAAMMKTKECVIAIPAADIAKKAIQIGTCSGSEIDKFKKFKLTLLKSKDIKAPLIKECYINIECKITDYVKKYGIFILQGLSAYIDSNKKDRRLIHAIGDGTFVLDGTKLNYRKIMKEKLPTGV
ncbi:MAG: flavin reductase family protein [Endomicrobium sp.]|jgi:flavin reductase (DIM6/NTAB) family NADH-FMN oxidoreductase RutF|nr:flavin reductase family protein [Endomicrobium sp.]